MMSRSRALLFCTAFLLVLSGCTRVHIDRVSAYELPRARDPAGVAFTVLDAEGNIVHKGRTPETVHIDRSPWYYRKAVYKVIFSADDYDARLFDEAAGWTAQSRSSMLVVGGPRVAFVLLDPFTGKMYTYPLKGLNKEGEIREALNAFTYRKIDTDKKGLPVHFGSIENLPVVLKGRLQVLGG